MTDNRTTELQVIMDEFEHECFMLRVEASETRARDDVVRKSYERIRGEFAGRIAATLGSEREAELVRAMEDVLRHSTDTVWVGEAETLVDRMVSLGVYKHDVYEGVRPWEATNER